MSVLSKDEFFNRLNERIGTSQDDDDIAFMEDMTDTYTHLENQAKGDGVDWHQKMLECDAAWRKKYRSRFFSSGGGNSPEVGGVEEEEKNAADVTFDDIFRPKGG